MASMINRVRNTAKLARQVNRDRALGAPLPLRRGINLILLVTSFFRGSLPPFVWCGGGALLGVNSSQRRGLSAPSVLCINAPRPTASNRERGVRRVLLRSGTVSRVRDGQQKGEKGPQAKAAEDGFASGTISADADRAASQLDRA
jgi:hypothetical protein